MLKIYTLANCDTCRKATRWLRDQGVNFSEHAIRETPPTLAELRAALAANDGDLRKLFNTSGRDYREQGVAGKLPTMTVPAALEMLAGSGSLVKRPFLIGEGVVRVGFNATAWEAALAGR